MPYEEKNGTFVLPIAQFLKEDAKFSKYGKFVFVDDNGVKISPPLAYVSGYSEGISLVAKERKHYRMGFSDYPKDCYFVDKDLIPLSAVYESATPFHGKYALVTLKGSDQKEVGFVDRQFKYTFLCNGDRPYFHYKDFWIICGEETPTLVFDSNLKELFRTPEPVSGFDGEPLSFQSRRGNRLYFYVSEKGGFREKSGEIDWWKTREFPLVMRTKGEEWNGTHAIVGKGKVFLVGPEFADFDLTESDRAIKIKYGQFNKSCWLNQDSTRLREFYAFLRENNPIGMSKSQIEKLLGPGAKQKGDSLSREKLDLPPDPTVASYQLNWFGAWCASSTWFAEFRYQNDRVKEWRIYKRTDRSNSFWNRS